MEQSAWWDTISLKSVKAMFLRVLWNNTVCQVFDKQEAIGTLIKTN